MRRTAKVKLFLILLAAVYAAQGRGGVLVTRTLVREVADASHLADPRVEGIRMTVADDPVRLRKISELKMEKLWPSEPEHMTNKFNSLEKTSQSEGLVKYRAGQDPSSAGSLHELQQPDSSVALKLVVGGEAAKYSRLPPPLEKPFSSLETYATMSLKGAVHQENAEKDAARILRNLLQGSDSRAISIARQDVRKRLLDVFKLEQLNTRLTSTSITPEAWDTTLNGLITQFTKLGQPVEFAGFKEIENELKKIRIDGNLIICFSRAVSTPTGESIKEYEGPISKGFQELFSAATNFDEAYDRLISDFRYVDNLSSTHRDEVLDELSKNLRDYRKGGHPEEMATDYSKERSAEEMAA